MGKKHTTPSHVKPGTGIISSTYCMNFQDLCEDLVNLKFIYSPVHSPFKILATPSFWPPRNRPTVPQAQRLLKRRSKDRRFEALPSRKDFGSWEGIPMDSDRNWQPGELMIQILEKDGNMCGYCTIYIYMHILHNDVGYLYI